jgi:hypothetical protein
MDRGPSSFFHRNTVESLPGKDRRLRTLWHSVGREEGEFEVFP